MYEKTIVKVCGSKRAEIRGARPEKVCLDEISWAGEEKKIHGDERLYLRRGKRKTY